MLGFVWIGGTDLFLKGIVRITNKRNFHRRILEPEGFAVLPSFEFESTESWFLLESGWLAQVSSSFTLSHTHTTLGVG